MKKALILIFIVLISFTQIDAQVRGGVFGALNFADLNLENTHLNNSFGGVSGLTTFAAGAVLEFNIYENLYLQIEPSYINRGGIPKIPIPIINLTYNASYIEIPVLFKAKMGKKIAPYILGGISAGFLLESNFKAEAFGLELNMDVENFTESFNFGIEFGLGVEIPFEELTLFLESRYTVGLKNIIKSGKIPFYNSTFEIIPDFEIDNSTITTRDLQIIAGINFPLSM